MTQYLFKKKKVLVAVKLFDRCLSFFCKNKGEVPQVIQKIVLSNMAHLGDLVMATAILPLLRKAFPQATIGMVIGSWNKEVLQNHPLIDEIYLFDHIKLNRMDRGFFRKLWRHFRTRYSTLKGLRRAQYDVAIDLYYYFPNASVLFWQAAIPVRMGYSSGGLGPLFTHLFHYEEKDQYLAQYYLPFLEALRIPHELFPLLHTTLPISSVVPGNYLVIHMGVGDPQREWGDQKWAELIQLFDRNHIPLVFTGSGVKEERRIHQLQNREGKNLCNRLNFSEFLLCVKGALLTISPDTGIIHLAAALEIPSLVLFSKEVNPHQRIQNDAITIKMHLTDSPQEVYEKAMCMLNLSK